jgi:hypothetical protein
VKRKALPHLLAIQTNYLWVFTHENFKLTRKYTVPYNNSSTERVKEYRAIDIITYLLTSWCRILFEKLTVARLIKKYPAFFMKLEGSLPFSQKPATEPYPEPTESSSPHRSLSP